MWQKESKHKNALYVNICAANGSRNRLNEIYNDVRGEINANKEMKQYSMKCDKMSKTIRQSGNEYFHNRNWNDAIENFNESLCFATIGSPNIGFAYANRSACFFNLKLFDKCLVDIELAKRNNYPKHLFPELEKRKDSCLKHISEQQSTINNDAIQLNCSEDEHFHGMSSAIKMHTQSGAHSMIAKQDIQVGEVVAFDKAFTKTLYTIYGWKCNICLKSNTNLVPCKKCTTAMFCHECEDNNLHKYECGLKTSVYSIYNNFLMLELRTFFVALNLFASADEMMMFVEQSLANGMPVSVTDDRSKYRAFLNLINNFTDSDEQFPSIVFCVYKILLDIPKVQSMFQSKKHRRFLMHLIGHHVQINIRHSYTATKVAEDGNKSELRKLYSQVGLMLGLFNHSCSPNVLPVDHDADTVYIVIRPIRANEEMFINKYAFHWDLKYEHGYRDFNFKCCCERCEGRQPPQDEIERLISDPLYPFIFYCSHELKDGRMNGQIFNVLKKACVRLLNIHGRMIWCYELCRLIFFYIKLISGEYSGTLRIYNPTDSLDNQ